MSREFYQEGWGRRQNRCDNNNINYPFNNAVESCNSYQGNMECMGEMSGVRYDMPNMPEVESDIVNTSCQQMNSDNVMNDESYQAPFSGNVRNTKAYQGAQSEGTNQVKCCPFDAYGLNTYDPYYTKINVVKDPIGDIFIPFTISVKVPVGFVLPPNMCYDQNLAMDKSDLSINLMTQYYVYVDVDSCDCNSTEVVKMQVATLTGPIYYNLTVGNFVPAQPIQDINLAQGTYFNSMGVIDIDKIIAYIPFGYEGTAPYYTIDVIAEKETVTLPNGKCVSKRNACEEYCCTLANPDVERILNFSYTLVIKSRSM